MLRFQLNGLMSCVTLYQKRINDAFALCDLRKRSLYAKNLRFLRLRKMNGKKNSIWVKKDKKVCGGMVL